ncbi:MAG TPA: GAF domain-containing protein, partial [Ferrovaceae bacterium]|nr:GAF domain-containing protein [Ferrovaceae bacterium]HQU07422.1 GAF domain-containing protein [Ferrovaceae bacterium]
MTYNLLLNVLPLATILCDEFGTINYANKAFKSLFNYDESSIVNINKLAQSLFPESNPHNTQFINILQQQLRLSENQYLSFDVDMRLKDNLIHKVQICVATLVDNESKFKIIFFNNIIDYQITKFKLEKITKLYKAISHINQAIVKVESEESLFPLVCKMAVDYGGMTLATVRKKNPNNNRLETFTNYGQGSDFFKQVIMSIDENIPEGKGPAGIAWRENKMVIVKDYQNSQLTKPWHKQAKIYGWGCSGTFPIQKSGKPYAIIAVYHKDKDAFDSEIIELLNEMTRDISFALDSYDYEIKSRIAAVAFESQEAMIVTDA